jgi:hypothetical protein
LDIVSKALEKKGNNLTGPLVGLTPDILENLALPENVDAREAVSEVVQRNLRLVLGAQFTENEGKLLIARAYNPKLKPEINAKRVKRLLNQMKSALRAKEDAVRYVKTHGTLKGFEGNLVDSIDDFNLDEPQTGTPNKTSSRKTTNKDIDDMSESELDAFLKGKK